MSGKIHNLAGTGPKRAVSRTSNLSGPPGLWELTSKDGANFDVCHLVRSLKAKTILFNAGDAAASVFEVLEGIVMLFSLSEDGRRTVIAFMQPGDFFEFVVGSHYSYFAETTGSCVVWSWPRTKLWRQIHQDPVLAEKFVRLEGCALEKFHEHLILLTRRTPLERVSFFLLEMMERQGVCANPVRHVYLPMTRVDIADFLGLAIETISRCLSHLRRHKMIQLMSRQSVVIVDVEGLRHYASGQRQERLGADLAANGSFNNHPAPIQLQGDLFDELSKDGQSGYGAC